MLWSGAKKSFSSSLTDLVPKKPLMLKGSVGDDLEHLEKDRAIRTDPDDNRRRRTIRLVKKSDSWGFTLQTYGVKNKRSNEIEVMTYVDYVEYNGPAWLAGLQRGDIFLSINGEPAEGATHQQLVDTIRKAGQSMRLVVLFEDCCRKVELYEKFIKLKQVLSMKLAELQRLKLKENSIMKVSGLIRVEETRMSSRSTQSSISSDWDRFSVIGNSVSLTNLPSHIRNKRKHLAVNDSLSDMSFDNDSFSDSESGLCLTMSSSDLVHISNNTKVENDDSISEYSLPLNSHYQLGGKLLSFSEDDSGSIISDENIVPSDKYSAKTVHKESDTSDQSSQVEENQLSDTTDKSCDVPHDVLCDAPHGVSCDAPHDVSCDAPHDVSCDAPQDVICDAPQDVLCDAPHNVLCDDTQETQVKRYENGILINEEDALTRL